MAVYFARAEGTNFVKIGFATTVSRRMLHLQAGCPYKLTVVRVELGDRRVESAFHALFAEHHLERDWFNWSPRMAKEMPRPAPVVPIVLASGDDDLSNETEVAKNIKKYGPRNVAAISGIPYWTLVRWRQQDRVPGEGKAKEWRLNQLKDAVEKLKAQEAAA